MPKALTFYTTPNRGMECGKELIVFKTEIAPYAGGCTTPTNSYGTVLPPEFHNGYNAWFLRGSDHKDIFYQLRVVFDPTSLRQKADDIESGVLVDEEWDPEDLRHLAEEIEKLI